jgi:hypothetical protein
LSDLFCGVFVPDVAFKSVTGLKPEGLA